MNLEELLDEDFFSFVGNKVRDFVRKQKQNENILEVVYIPNSIKGQDNVHWFEGTISKIYQIHSAKWENKDRVIWLVLDKSNNIDEVKADIRQLAKRFGCIIVKFREVPLKRN